MTDYKSLLASKSVWGGVVVVLATVAQLAGVEVGADDQAAMTDILFGAAQLVGSAVAVYGRITATKRIR